MRSKIIRWSALVALLAVALLSALPAQAEDKDDDKWYEKFKGHEMWMTDLNAGKQLSSKESRPMLIDFFSPG